MKNLSFLLFALVSLALCSCNSKTAIQGHADSLDQILVNQVGYFPNSNKVALLRIKTEAFNVVDTATGKVVFTGKPSQLEYWELSGDSVATADFSELTTPGTYRICLNDNSICSQAFSINNSVYTNIAKASLKALYLNRSGMEITKEFGGEWAHAAGHPDTMVLVHASAATKKRPEGYKLSSPGGWYDAGDYNKYIVNSGISTYTLLLFCQMYPEYTKSLNANIPESGNAIPDVLDELLYNLRWMLTMQDPNDGGVYHKLTNLAFGGFEMPDKATEPRFVVLKSTAASLDFAATMAMASRVLAKSDVPEIVELGKECLDKAQKAYAWAKANPAIYYKNPSDVSTGAYDDSNIKDEFFWATSELALATNDFSTLSGKDLNDQAKVVQSWGSVSMLGTLSLAISENSAYKVEAQKVLVDFANQLVEKSTGSPYRVSLDIFNWGSNSDVANMGVIKMVAYQITSDKKYLNSAQTDIDYLLGRNATGYCFVTGFGGKQVMNIHHRPSGADGVAAPYPGFLSGGPNIVVLTDCPDVTRSTFPAKSFVDQECSYSTNEIAINWNAPLFFLLGAMDSMKK